MGKNIYRKIGRRISTLRVIMLITEDVHYLVFCLYRCGALHPGDQLLAFDDHVIDGNNYTAEEVMCYLENCEGGFTRLHIAPRHVLTHGGRFASRGESLS